jgi:hypothetical protein
LIISPAKLCPSYLDVSSRVETIQLVDELQHGSLHLIVTSRTIIEPENIQ